MPSPTTAILTGSTLGAFGVASTDFTVTLDQPADVGGLAVTVTDSVGVDTVSTSPFTIAAGATTGTFTITPSTYGNRDISITTSPVLAIVGSPITYSSRPSTATLFGPTSLACGVPSSTYTVLLNAVAGAGGIDITITDSEAGDAITPSSFTIAAGDSSGTFTVTPVTCGDRSISISTTAPGLTIVGSPITANVPCNCPDDAGASSRSQFWGTPTVTCPDAFSVTVTTTPSNFWAKELYCSTSLLTMTITA